MTERYDFSAMYLPSEVREKLKVRQIDEIEIVCEDGKVFLRNKTGESLSKEETARPFKQQNYKLNADFLPIEVRKKLFFCHLKYVVIVYEDGQVLLKNQTQNALEVFYEVIKDDVERLGIETCEDAIEFSVKCRHGEI